MSTIPPMRVSRYRPLRKQHLTQKRTRRTPMRQAISLLVPLLLHGSVAALQAVRRICGAMARGRRLLPAQATVLLRPRQTYRFLASQTTTFCTTIRGAGVIRRFVARRLLRQMVVWKRSSMSRLRRQRPSILPQGMSTMSRSMLGQRRSRLAAR